MKLPTEEKSLPGAREPLVMEKSPTQIQVSQALRTEVKLGEVSTVDFLAGKDLRVGSECQWAQESYEGFLNCH